MSLRMPVHLDKFIEALAVLADNRGMQLTMKQSGKGALLCSGMALLGKYIFTTGEKLRSTVSLR